MKKLASLAFAAAVFLAPAQSSAQTSTANPLCQAWTTASWTHCLGAYDPLNGIAPGQMSLSDAFTGFLNTQAWKTKANPSVLELTGPWEFDRKTDVPGEATSGSINLSFLGASDPFVLGLKGSTSTSFYVFNGGASNTFAFNMAGSATNKGGKAQGISHFAIWTLKDNGGGGGGNCTGGNCVVPEPSGYSLALAGFAALGFASLRRRRRSV